MLLEHIKERYPEEADRRWIKYISSEAERIINNNDSWVSSFLTPYRRQITEEILACYRDIDYISYGGYPGAKRVRIRAWSVKNTVEELPPLVMLHLTGDISREDNSEYDLIKAFYELGLQEDMIGDILWDDSEEGVKVFVMESVSDRMVSDLNKVIPKNIIVRKELELKPEIINSRNGKTIRGTVASMRLDAIISLGCGLSRSKAVNIIKGGLVKVNWKTETNSSARVKEEDYIVLSNGGGFVIESLPGKSRKGRQNIVLKKYNN